MLLLLLLLSPVFAAVAPDMFRLITKARGDGGVGSEFTLFSLRGLQGFSVKFTPTEHVHSKVYSKVHSGVDNFHSGAHPKFHSKIYSEVHWRVKLFNPE